jgi:hypothetical protein
MEAPTSNHTGTNLYNKEKWFSIAPPYHPGFSGCNQMEATTSCVQEPLETHRTTVLPTTMRYETLLQKFIIVIQYFSMAYEYHHCSSILLFSTYISVFLLTSSCTFYSSTLSLHAHLNILFYAHESQLKTPLLLSILCIFTMPSPLPDHAHNSLSSLEVTVFDTFPSVNCLYDESSFHWKLSRDSSAPLVITPKLFKFSGRYHQSILEVTERTFAHSSLLRLFAS